MFRPQPRRITTTFSVLALALSVGIGAALFPGLLPAQTIAEATEGLERQEGFIPLHWGEDDGRLLLEVRADGQDFLYLTSLATGLGTRTDIFLDRGTIAGTFTGRWVRGPGKVFLELQNPNFTAGQDPDPALARSVEESFPVSRVAAFDIVAIEGEGPEARLLIDATSYFLSDAVGVAERLQNQGGSYRLASDRGMIHRPRTKAFPENTEVEAALTFVSDRPAGAVARNAPDGRAMTIRQHHSFARLPDDDFRPRAFDPRIGLFAVSHYDFSRSLDQEYVVRYAMRHRLQKRDPGAAMSEPVEPIVYYLDPAVPEPYRTAFIEGGEWWNEVFEAAGYIDAFRIEEMPAEMDPLDARYHVIQWVHRTEASSSIGPSIVDPRTGEIIKAAVRMDSHRSLQDFNLYAGVIPATGSGAGVGGAGPGSAGGPEYFLGAGGGLDWMAELDPNVSAEDFAMARRRQHSAHEIGHTLGLAHNFIAASYGRGSVMDYPAPLIEWDGNAIDLSDAYRDGPGVYDTVAIRWAYAEFDPEVEADSLNAILLDAQRRGVAFITNPDEGSSSSLPQATTWVNGSDMLDEFDRVNEVRRVLIDRFDESAVEEGEALWRLQERFTPVYLHHRFTLGAVVKAIGGMEFRYAVRGDVAPATRIVPADRQRRALEQIAAAIHPDALEIPESVLEILPPRAFGHAPVPWDFGSDAGPAFDPVGVARILTTMAIEGVLDPERAARVVALHHRDPSLPTLESVIERLIEATWRESDGDPVLRRMTQRVIVDALIGLAAEDDASPEARAGAEWGLVQIDALARAASDDPSAAAHRMRVRSDIRRWMDEGIVPEGSIRLPNAPPGTPIGGGGQPS